MDYVTMYVTFCHLFADPVVFTFRFAVFLCSVSFPSSPVGQHPALISLYLHLARTTRPLYHSIPLHHLRTLPFPDFFKPLHQVRDTGSHPLRKHHHDMLHSQCTGANWGEMIAVKRKWLQNNWKIRMSQDSKNIVQQEGKNRKVNTIYSTFQFPFNGRCSPNFPELFSATRFLEYIEKMNTP